MSSVLFLLSTGAISLHETLKIAIAYGSTETADALDDKPKMFITPHSSS